MYGMNKQIIISITQTYKYSQTTPNMPLHPVNTNMFIRYFIQNDYLCQTNCVYATEMYLHVCDNLIFTLHGIFPHLFTLK